MAITPLNPHYAIENPATIFDEESLTALQLVARTTGKVNECVEEVNKIPEKVKEDVQTHIDGGDFDEQIDQHTKDLTHDLAYTEAYLNARIDNLLTNQTPGSDAEIADIRVGWDMNVYTSAGEAVRKSVVTGTRIAAGNYQAILPDLNHAKGPRYVLNFASGTPASEMPANVPFSKCPDDLILLENVTQGVNVFQTLKWTNRMYVRWGSDGNFNAWTETAFYAEQVDKNNYASVLPTLDTVTTGRFALNFAMGETENIPDGLPFDAIPQALLFLECKRSKNFVWQEITNPYDDARYIRWGRIGSTVEWFPWNAYNNNAADGKKALTISGGSLLEGFKRAYDTGCTRIIVEAGSYNIINEYKAEYGDDFFDNYTAPVDPFEWGLWVENMEVIFSPGAMVSCHYTGDNENVKTYFAPFNTANNAIIDGLVLDCTECRYGIHADFTKGADRSYTIFRNCDITFAKGDANRQAIGAGFGVHDDWLVENCIFRTDVAAYVVRIHNNVSAEAKSRAVFRNCYVDGLGHFRFCHYSDSTEESVIMVTGCTFGAEPSTGYEIPGATTPKNMRVISYNNECHKLGTGESYDPIA